MSRNPRIDNRRSLHIISTVFMMINDICQKVHKKKGNEDSLS